MQTKKFPDYPTEQNACKIVFPTQRDNRKKTTLKVQITIFYLKILPL